MSITKSLGSLRFSLRTNSTRVTAKSSRLIVWKSSRMSARTCDQEESSWAIIAVFTILYHFSNIPMAFYTE